MAFHYTDERPSQHLLVLALTAGLVGLGAWPAFQQAWAITVGTFGDRVLLVAGPLLLHLALFWVVSGLFHVADTTDRPAWVVRHRIQSGPPRRPPARRVVRVVLVNQLVLSPLLLWGMAEVMIWRGWTASFVLPSIGRFLLELVLLGVAAVLVFYAAHRFLHRPWWMKRVHRVHHEFRTTAAVASEYAHPVEFVVANFGVLAAGVLLFLPHLASIYAFTLIALTVILVHHSGYALPWAPYPVHHDWHHYRYKEVFGTTGVLDRLLGTDEEFRTLEDGDVR